MVGHRRQRIVMPREVLLIEIERRCRMSPCEARNRLGLTKEEARDYLGFTCERCEAWNPDTLSERDIPDWWEELRVTGLGSLRGADGVPAAEVDPSETVRRLSELYREQHGESLFDADRREEKF